MSDKLREILCNTICPNTKGVFLSQCISNERCRALKEALSEINALMVERSEVEKEIDAFLRYKGCHFEVSEELKSKINSIGNVPEWGKDEKN